MVILTLLIRVKRRALNWLLPLTLLILSSPVAKASVGSTLVWSPSLDPAVTGYNIYFGTASRNYTGKINVGDATTAYVGNLLPNTTYYFAATTYDAAGNESAFSPEVIQGNYQFNPQNGLALATCPPALTNDQVVFSLAAGAPAGVAINPTNGILSWMPGVLAPSQTSAIAINVTDLNNPGASTQISLQVTVGDYLGLALPAAPVVAAATGQTGMLPITLTANSGVTNCTFSVGWDGNRLLNPTLACYPPVAGGTLLNQGSNLVIQIWTANGQSLIGTNLVGQIQFTANQNLQNSAFLNLPFTAVAGAKTDGTSFANTNGQSGEVVFVGTQPLLRPTCAGGTRTLTCFANPGFSYELQCATNFASPSPWQPVATCQQTNVAQDLTFESAPPMAFYRLKQL